MSLLDAAEKFETLAQYQQTSNYTVDYCHNYLDATVMTIEKAKRALTAGKAEICKHLIHDAYTKLDHILEKISE